MANNEFHTHQYVTACILTFSPSLYEIKTGVGDLGKRLYSVVTSLNIARCYNMYHVMQYTMLTCPCEYC